MSSTAIQSDGTGNAGEDPEPELLVLALRDTSRALQTFLTVQARANGLGLPELLTLARSAEGDGVTPAEASRALGMRSSTMTGLSDRLEKERLVRRVPHPSDRRLLLLTATPAGHELLEHVLGPLVTSLGELIASADPAERRFLSRFLRQISLLLVQNARRRP